MRSAPSVRQVDQNVLRQRVDSANWHYELCVCAYVTDEYAIHNMDEWPLTIGYETQEARL